MEASRRCPLAVTRGGVPEFGHALGEVATARPAGEASCSPSCATFATPINLPHSFALQHVPILHTLTVALGLTLNTPPPRSSIKRQRVSGFFFRPPLQILVPLQHGVVKRRGPLQRVPSPRDILQLFHLQEPRELALAKTVKALAAGCHLKTQPKHPPQGMPRTP
jgi:hypothetical protein